MQLTCNAFTLCLVLVQYWSLFLFILCFLGIIPELRTRLRAFASGEKIHSLLQAGGFSALFVDSSKSNEPTNPFPVYVSDTIVDPGILMFSILVDVRTLQELDGLLAISLR